MTVNGNECLPLWMNGNEQVSGCSRSVDPD